MVNKPLGQTVPLVRRPSVDGQAWLYMLILALLQATGHFLKKMVRGRVHQVFSASLRLEIDEML